MLWTLSLFAVIFRGMGFLARLLTRYWGYLAVVIAIAGFFLNDLGLAAVLALALAALGYFLLQAPVWCGAETRAGERCRNNSHGLLCGCSYRQHKWQLARQAFTPAGARAVLAAGKSVSGVLALAGSLMAGVQALIVLAVFAFR